MITSFTFKFKINACWCSFSFSSSYPKRRKRGGDKQALFKIWYYRRRHLLTKNMVNRWHFLCCWFHHCLENGIDGSEKTYSDSQKHESSCLLGDRFFCISPEPLELQKIYLHLFTLIFEELSAGIRIFQIRWQNQLIFAKKSIFQ